MTYRAIAAALATLLFSSSASAWDNPQSNSLAAKPAEKTYCLQFSLDTGSRISRMECKTQRDGARLGVDVDNLSDK